MKIKLLALALAAMVVVPAFAQDDTKAKKQGKGKKAGAAQTASAQLIKQLEVVGLTDDQVAKIKQLGKTSDEAIKKLQSDAGLTPELLKKRRDTMASMKDSELKGKKKVAAIDEAAGLSEAQAAAFAKANELRAKLKEEAIKLLSDEQKEKLPATLKPTTAKKADGEKPAKKADAKKKDAA